MWASVKMQNIRALPYVHYN